MNPLSSSRIGTSREGYLPFGWSRLQYAIAALVYFLGISLLSAHIPGKIFEVLPDLPVVLFVRHYVTNLAHVPLFGGFAFFMLFALGGEALPFSRRPLPYAMTLLFTAIFGTVDEIHQAFVPGRFPSHIDILLDVLGGALACSYVSFRSGGGTRKRESIVLLAVLSGAALGACVWAVVAGHQSTLPWRRLAAAAFPLPESGLIDGFENENAWKGGAPRSADLEKEDFILVSSSAWTTEGKSSLRCDLPVADWSGVSTRVIPVDLSGFLHLSVDLLLPEDTSIRKLGFRLVDYDGVAAESFVAVSSGESTVVVDLSSFGEELDLSRLDVLSLMVRGQKRRVGLSLDRLRALGELDPRKLRQEKPK